MVPHRQELAGGVTAVESSCASRLSPSHQDDYAIDGDGTCDGNDRVHIESPPACRLEDHENGNSSDASSSSLDVVREADEDDGDDSAASCSRDEEGNNHRSVVGEMPFGRPPPDLDSSEDSLYGRGGRGGGGASTWDGGRGAAGAARHRGRSSSRLDMIRMGIGSRESIRDVVRSDQRQKRLEALGIAEEEGDYTTEEESSEADSEDSAYLDLPQQGLLEEGQNYLAMSMLVYIYALLREMAVLGYTETDFRAIDVNRWVRWYEDPPEEDSSDDDYDEDVSLCSRGSSISADTRNEDTSSVAQSTIGGTRRVRRYEKYLRNTRTAGSIIRCVLEELEREHQRAEEEDGDDDVGSRAGQHDISVIKEFQHWVDDSRSNQEDDAAEKAIKELQRQVAKKRWKRAVQAVMARSRFKFILAAAKAAKEAEREELEGKKEEKVQEESVREKMERKKQAVRRQLEKEMKEGGDKGNVNSWFTLQKRVIQSHFDDEAHEDEEAQEENAKRRPTQCMIDRVVEDSLPSFFKPGSVLNLMMEQGTEVVYFGDRHPNEAIYCVCVCRRTRTVTVIFRGSVTAHNWVYNMKLMMSDQPNPLAREQYEGRSDFVKLHTGFGLYMLRKRKDTGQTKICEIFERIDRIGRELAPDGRYRVAVTGHSLGGALSTIFSFYAACDKRFTTLGPVRTFTFAAPRVGDELFRSAYERLEATGRLRHARFSNIKDIVPLTPTFSIHGTRVGPWYKHVGLQVKLHETTGLGKLQIMKSVDASYPRDKHWMAEALRALGHGNNFLFNLTTLKGFGKNHSLSEHQRRLNFVYQYRRQLLEADLRGDQKRKMKSMEEYYRVKAGIGCAAIVEEPRSVKRGKAVKRVVIFVLVFSAMSVVIYVFCALCPIGINMRARYCADGGWKLICDETVELPSGNQVKDENMSGVDMTKGEKLAGDENVSESNQSEEVEESVSISDEEVSPAEDGKSEDSGVAAPEIVGEDAEAADVAVEDGKSKDSGVVAPVIVGEDVEAADVAVEEGELSDEPEDSSAHVNASLVMEEVGDSMEERTELEDTNEEGSGCEGTPTVAAPSPDSPVWGSRMYRRRAPIHIPSAQKRAESYARKTEQEARLAARAEAVPAAVKAKMASMMDPALLPEKVEVDGVSNTPRHVLGPLVVHVAGRVLPPFVTESFNS